MSNQIVKSIHVDLYFQAKIYVIPLSGFKTCQNMKFVYGNLLRNYFVCLFGHMFVKDHKMKLGTDGNMFTQ